MYEQGYRNSLRSAKQRRPLQSRAPLSQEPSEQEEEEQSSEDTPLLIRRKKKSILKPESRNKKPCSGSKSSRDDANKPCGTRTGKPSRNVLVRLSGPESRDESEPSPKEKTSSESSASLVAARGRTSPACGQLQLQAEANTNTGSDTDTGSDTGTEEFHRKARNARSARASWLKTGTAASSSARPSAAKPREHERAKQQKSLELFPRAADGWSEKELQKLHR